MLRLILLTANTLGILKSAFSRFVLQTNDLVREKIKFYNKGHLPFAGEMLAGGCVSLFWCNSGSWIVKWALHAETQKESRKERKKDKARKTEQKKKERMQKQRQLAKEKTQKEREKKTQPKSEREEESQKERKKDKDSQRERIR